MVFSPPSTPNAPSANDAPNPAEIERRYKRHAVRSMAQIEALEPHKLNTIKSVQLFDISLGGVRFLTDEPIALDSMWRVTFLQNDQQAGSQSVDVRVCEQVAEGQYLIGAQFIAEPYLLTMIGVNSNSLSQQPQHDENDFKSIDEVLDTD
jgi:hypothetical protein